jgi:hypothetical protein
MIKLEAAQANIDYSKLFEKGPCPKVEGMKNIEYQKLSGEWFLQRTDEPSVPELLPACHHAIFTVQPDGTFTAREELRVAGKPF